MVGPLSYRPCGPEGAVEWQGDRVGRGRRLPGDLNPIPTSNAPGARALRAFPRGAHIGGRGGVLRGQRCAHPPVAAYTPAGACTPMSRGEEPGDGAVKRLRYWIGDELCLASRILAVAAGLYPPHRDTRPLSNLSPRAKVGSYGGSGLGIR